MVDEIDGEQAGHSRRGFLVRMMGVVLGVFALPGFAGAAAEAAAEAAREGISPAPLPTLDMLDEPTFFVTGDGEPVMLYLNSDCEAMMWHAETEEEIAEMRRLYEAALNPGCPQVAETEVFPIVRGDEERRLLAAIVADPESDRHRLEYADWLQSQGDPRGEFMHGAILTDRIPQSDPRYQPTLERAEELAGEHGEAWFRPLAALRLWPSVFGNFNPWVWIRKGMIDEIDLNVAGILPEKAELLFAAAPALTRLSIKLEQLDVAAIAACPEMRQIRHLRFENAITSSFDDEAMRGLLASRYLTALESLNVNGSRLEDVGLQRLAASPLLAQLRELDLCACKLTAAGVVPLASAPAAARLVDLNVTSNQLGPEGIRALLTSPHLKNLESLKVGLTHPEGAIAESPEQVTLARLETLQLSINGLKDADVLALLKWPAAKNLADVDLSSNELTSAAAMALAQAGALPRLRKLDLSRNAIGDRGASALAASEYPFTHLSLSRCEITAEGVRSLANAASLERLVELDLFDNPIGVDGAQALAASPYLAALTSLRVGERTIGEAGRAALEARFGSEVLQLSEESEPEATEDDGEDFGDDGSGDGDDD